jgi:predicted Zn-dependent peptidase
MVFKRILDNGVTVLVDEMRDVRSFSLGFFVGAGSADEHDGRRGLSHFLEHLLFKRTRHRSNAEIARAIDRLGGDETERGVILEEIGEANDNPEDLVHEMFVRSFWKGHPLGAPILGTEETVRSIGREDLYAYYRSRYTPGNLIVSIAGHVGTARALASVERLFRRRGARSGGRAARRVSLRRPRSHQHVQVRSRRGLEQVHVCLGVAGPGQLSDRRFVASLLDVVLGGGMSSRLFQEVREKRGLVYSIGSSLNAYRLGGYESISAACAPKNLLRVLEVTLRELARLKRAGVRPREMRWAKENLKGNMILSLESTVARMSSAARQEFYLGRVVPLEDWIAKIEAVTEGELGEEAERSLDGRVLSLSVVGNVADLPVSGRDLAAALSA